MWDSNSPLQLLKTMPSRLGKEELEKLQAVLEADKYKNSLISGFDLCGMYAPFCRGCSKASIYPCAVAYVNMMKESGMDVDVAARPVEEVRQDADVSQSLQSAVGGVSGAVAEDTSVAAEQTVAEQADAEQSEVEEVTPRIIGKIRIAVARRKL